MTRDVFGTYIDTYKFHQAVADKVVLDLKYEARDVPERLTSQAAIDRSFEPVPYTHLDVYKRQLDASCDKTRALTQAIMPELFTGRARLIHAAWKEDSGDGLRPHLNFKLSTLN